MPAKKILNYARSRSETTRKYIAYGVTGLITGIVIAVWLVSLVTHRFNVSPTTARQTNNEGLENLRQGIAEISDTTTRIPEITTTPTLTAQPEEYINTEI